MDDKKKTWRLENKVSLATLLTLVGALWTFSGRVTTLEARGIENTRRIEICEAYDSNYTNANIDIMQRLTRVEEKAIASLASGKRVEDSLDKIKEMIMKGK